MSDVIDSRNQCDRPLAGIGYAVLSVFAFSVLDVLAKAAVALLPTFQILAIRSVMVLVAIAPVIRYLGGWRSIRTRQPWVHATRGLCSMGALWNAEAWWRVIWYAGFRGLVAQLGEAELARFKQEHLAEIGALHNGQGIPFNVTALFASGRVA